MAIKAKGYWSQIIMFLLPGMSLMLVFIYLPFFCALGYAFFDWDGYPGSPMKWVGFANFLEMPQDTKLIQSIWNVLILLVTAVMKAIFFPVLVAELIYNLRSERMAYLYRVLFVLPMVVPGLVSIYIWGSFYGGEGGLINELLALPLETHERVFGTPVLEQEDIKSPSLFFQKTLSDEHPLAPVILSEFTEDTQLIIQANTGSEPPKEAAVRIVLDELNTMLFSEKFLHPETIEAPDFPDNLAKILASTPHSEPARLRRNRNLLSQIFPESIAPAQLLPMYWISDPLLGIAQWLYHQQRAWLNDPKTALWSLVFMGFPWCGGIAILIVLAGLISIPEDVRASAILDGAVGLRRVWHIDLPHLAGQIKLIVVLTMLAALQGFEAQFVLTGGGPDDTTLVPALHMYNNAFKYDRLGYGAAVAVVLFLVMVALTYLNTKLQKSEVS